MGFSDLRQELVASVESDLFTVNTSKLEPEDIVAETEAYFETLTSVESSLDAIELSDASVKVLDEAIAEMESDNFDTAIAKANAVHELITGQPLEVATVEADDEENKKSVIEKIKEFLKKILNFIKEKGKAIWNKIYTLFQKIKNIIAGYVGKKLFVRKLDKFMEECKNKKPAREFTEDEIKKIAKEAYIYADKEGKITYRSLMNVISSVSVGYDIVEKLADKLDMISKDVVKNSDKLMGIISSINSKKILHISKAKIYTIKFENGNLDLIENKEQNITPDKIKYVQVLTTRDLEDMHKFYEKIIEVAISEFKKMESGVRKISENIATIEKEVDKIENEEKVKKIKKDIEVYKKLVLNILPKLYVINIENIRVAAIPKIGTWLDLSCKVLKEGKKEDKSKEEK